MKILKYISQLFFLLIIIISAYSAAAHADESPKTFTIYGQTISSDDEKIDLRRIHADDNGEALRQILPFMKNCTLVDLDQSYIDEEQILAMREAFPDIKFVWRVSFSTGYCVRTDVKTILASLVGDYGLTDDASCLPLTYCTDVVNLDIGHNNILTTIDFVRYMPNLERLIIAKDNVKDISALAECKKLKYLELFKNPEIEDISALSGLTELRDLEIGLLPKLTDISPIYDLELDRLWIGSVTPIPAEQVAEYARRHPDCVINLTDNDIDASWRYIEVHVPAAPNILWPQYQEIRNIFRYGDEDAWSFAANDPYFYLPHGAEIPVR